MAKSKSKVNKSAEIRALLSKNPKMPPKDIVSTLGGKGIKVNASLVYFVKGQMKERKGAKKKRRAAVRTAARNTKASNPVALILEVKALGQKAGGLGNLKQLVDALM